MTKPSLELEQVPDIAVSGQRPQSRQLSKMALPS